MPFAYAILAMEELEIFTKVLSSSHFTGKHYLAQELDLLMKEHPRFMKPIFNAFPGRKIDQRAVTYLDSEIRRNYFTYGLKQLWIILLGTNNLRYQDEDIAKFFHQISRNCAFVPKCHIIFCGLVHCL